MNAGTLITPAVVKSLAPRKLDSHKGENGSVLIIAGSRKYHGAEILAARAASLFADLVFVLTERENIPFAKNATPLIIVSEFDKKNLCKLAKRVDSILVGPGLSESKENKNLVNYALQKFKGKKFVLDATALHLVSRENLHKNCVVTPHSGEFRALFNKEPCSEEVVARARAHGCIVLLKGPTDYISDGEKLYVNKTGNPLMTAGGTGDVLAGVIAAFASKNPLLESALAATFLVGFAGDLIARKKSGLNAEMLVEMLPVAKKKCESQS